jgi:hypothetical protein
MMQSALFQDGEAGDRVLTGSTGRSMSTDKRWRHIYRCRIADLCQQYGYARFCWLGCFRWFTTAAEWEQHCQGHLDDPDSLPVQWGPLTFRGALAIPVLCGWCLFDTALLPLQRLTPCLDRERFHDHIEATCATNGKKRSYGAPIHAASVPLRRLHMFRN